MYRGVKESRDSNTGEEMNDNTLTELSLLERDSCKQNFQFYDKAKVGWVERFELPMLLTSKCNS